MVLIAAAPVLQSDTLSLFYTTDESLSDAPILVFYGSTSNNLSTSVSSYSRLQAHVYTPAGFQSYPRLAISPGSPLYAAVNCLPREEQGDEVSRALAFSLHKYFSELSEVAKDAWIKKSFTPARPSSALHLFSDAHAAELASRMVKVDNGRSVIKDLEHALAAQSVSHIDVDVILPPGSISQPPASLDSSEEAYDNTEGRTDIRYGKYAPLVESFGEVAFIPTSTVHRAPSRPTSINRTTYLSKAQKETVRREMCELVDTEERYVHKLVELVHSVAANFREAAVNASTDSLDTNARILSTLFPPSLDRILEVNNAFLESIRNLLEESENTAIEDIEKSVDGTSAQTTSMTDAVDATGTLAFAKSLFEWFPKFSEFYSDYIHAHSNFRHCLSTLASSVNSNYARLVQEVGDQRLMSLLIEPVQRLPRYSLYIDNIIKQLPVRHAAVRWLLRAKDLIAEICAQDPASSQLSRAQGRLAELISNLPADLYPQGRLIAAMDVQETQAPYNPCNEPNPDGCVLLLFADYVVLLHKPAQSTATARSLIAEIENHNCTFPPNVDQDRENDNRLVFSERFLLEDLDFAETANGCSLKVTTTPHRNARNNRLPRDRPMTKSFRVFILCGMYEGKASKVIKEVSKARVEGRYPEDEREKPAWEARNIDNDGLSIGMFSAIMEQGHEYQANNKSASTRIVIDEASGARTFALGEQGIEILATVALMGDGFYRLEIDALNEKKTRDLVTASEFFAVLNKRLGNLMQLRNQIRNPRVTVQLLEYHEDVLRSLKLSDNHIQEMFIKPRRPHSPVKVLSSLLSGSSSKESTKPAVPIKNTPVFSPPVPPKSFAESTLGSRRDDRSSTYTDTAKSLASTAAQSLEKTMSSYVLALHARKGNVVGRVITNRALADDAIVNELYNTLLGNPEAHEFAANVPVDVLFMSFEKFLKVAWKERMGRVLERRTIEELRMKAETLGPMDYQDFLLHKLQQCAPQNERAIKAVVGLLADLLDGTSNDGDRGALTATFTQLLVEERDSQEFILTIDRLVEEHDVILGNSPSFGRTVRDQSGHHAGSYSAHTGSIGSKATSLSKKLGFGSLHREASRSESSNKVSSVLRTWSKNGRSTESSARSALQRTKSVDMITHPATNATQHQASADSIQFQEAAPSQAQIEPLLDFAQSIMSPITPLSRPAVSRDSASIRTKRRSSLSDLAAIPAPETTVQRIGITPKKQNAIPRPVMRPPPAPASSPITALPQKNTSISVQPGLARHESVRLAAVDSKENTPPGGRQLQRSSYVRPSHTVADMAPAQSSSRTTILAQATTRPASAMPKQSASNSSALQPRGILSERPAFGNTAPQTTAAVKSVSSSGAAVRRDRLQSSQKLRERLETQKFAVHETGATLQTEIERIGEELSALEPNRQPSNASPAGTPQRHQSTMLNLSTRLRALETKVTHLTTNLAQNNVSIEKEYGFALQASESTAKQLEMLLHKAADEYEALCMRSNEELEKIFAMIGSPQGIDELRKKLVDSQEEASRYRREYTRLKCDNAILKSQLSSD